RLLGPRVVVRGASGVVAVEGALHCLLDLSGPGAWTRRLRLLDEVAPVPLVWFLLAGPVTPKAYERPHRASITRNTSLRRVFRYPVADGLPPEVRDGIGIGA